MKSKAQRSSQSSFLMPNLADQCDPRQPLVKLANKIPWPTLEAAFAECYSEQGRPAKAIRLMVGLLLLKQLENLSDEAVVERWVRDPYYQYFCGLEQFQWELPCDPTDLVYFRRHIGYAGATLILAVSAQMHGAQARETELVVDTTVQEKNITYPTDTKLYRKHPKRNRAARQGQRRLRTIAGKLVRELERKLPAARRAEQRENFALYRRVLAQQPQDKDKIYSLHEPQVYCVAKGKEHKPYEFGSKASVAMTKTHGVIVSVAAHPANVYDGHTLPEVLQLAEAIMGCQPSQAIVDRGYRGRKEVDGTGVLVPGPAPAGQSRSVSQRMRQRFRRRAAIEPVISHLKHDYRLARCFLKGHLGDALNLKLAAAAWNLRKWMRALLFWLGQKLRGQLFPGFSLADDAPHTLLAAS